MPSNQIVGPAAQFQMQDTSGITSITDSSTGTSSNTIAAITGGGAGCEDATKNAIASLAAKQEEILVVLRDLGLILAAYTDLNPK